MSKALPVKDNNPELAEQIKSHLNNAIERHPESVYTANTTNIPGIQQVAQITRETTILRTNKTTTKQVLFITNLPLEAATAEELLWMNRLYWQIENGLHYRKDLVFGEDR